MSDWIPAAAPNFMVGRAGHKINKVILHTTVGSMASTITTFQNPGRIASAHYVVGLDGRIVNMVKEANIAYHAGNFTVNEESIGIEHVDNGNYNGPRTPALYEASAQLVADICNRYGIPVDRTHIRKHSEVSDAPTACPDALNVNGIVTRAQALSLHGGGGGIITGDEMIPNDQFYRLLSAVYGVMLGADGTVQKDAKGVPIPTPATKMLMDSIAKIPGATPPDLHALAAAVATELATRLKE